MGYADPIYWKYTGETMTQSSSLKISPEPLSRGNLVQEAQAYVTQLFEQTVSPQLSFHDLRRVFEVARDAEKLARAAELNDEELETVQLASWFALSGFADGHPAVREKSLSIAERFLSAREYPARRLHQVLGCIRAAQDPSGPHKAPSQVTEEIVSDATIAYLAKKKFWRRADFLRLEIESIQGKSFSDRDWLALLGDRFRTTRFYSKAAQELYGEQRGANLKAVAREIDSHAAQDDEEDGQKASKGVETLFRTQSKTLTSLVATADRKAHMMITVNAITISILMHAMQEQIKSQPRMIVPLGILALVNLITIAISIFAVRPRTPTVTRVTHDDVVLKNGALMSQVIFSEISYEDFRHGVRKMMRDEDHLYDTLIQGLYGTARVLKDKFRLLRWAYSIFIYGFVASALIFAALLIAH